MALSLIPAKTLGGVLHKSAVDALAADLLPKHDYIWTQLLDVEQFGKLEPYDDAHKESRIWYPYMPSYGHADFPKFLTSSRELVLYVHPDREVILSIETSQTAAADQKNKRIILPAYVFDSPGLNMDDIEFDAKERAENVISAMNGFLLHEAAHFALSPETIPKMYDYGSVLHPKSWIEKQPPSPTIFNVVEDLFIEGWLRETYPAYEAFMKAAHNYYFNDRTLASRLIAAYGSTESWTDGLTSGEKHFRIGGGEFLDLLILVKNWRYQDPELWGPMAKEYVEMMLPALGMDDKRQRCQLATQVVEALMKDKRLGWKGESMVGACGAETSLDEEGRSVTIIGMTAEELREMSELATRRGEVNEIMDEFERDEIIILVQTDRHTVGKIEKAEVIKTRLYHSDLVEKDKRFIGFGRMLRRSFTHNYAPGEPSKKGQVLVSTRLYRIATDGKIFAHRERRKAVGKDYEIAILVDCSGSMSGSKVKEAMSVGASTWLSLKSARVRCMLFGHTTIDSPEKPGLFIFGLPHDSPNEVMRRCSMFLGGGAPLRNNIDGHALLAAAEHFSDRPTRKWLFHINDGQPAGRNYNGDAANAHTSVAANRIRRKGIDVVCITIDRGVWEVNDRIYGPDKNVKTTSPKVLKELVEAMFEKGDTDGEGRYSKR